MPEFLDRSALKTMMNNFTLAKAELYRQFKIAYDSDAELPEEQDKGFSR